MAPNLTQFKKHLVNTQAHAVTLGDSAVQGQELYLIVLICPFEVKIFYESMILSLSISNYKLTYSNSTQNKHKTDLCLGILQDHKRTSNRWKPVLRVTKMIQKALIYIAVSIKNIIHLLIIFNQDFELITTSKWSHFLIIKFLSLILINLTLMKKKSHKHACLNTVKAIVST